MHEPPSDPPAAGVVALAAALTGVVALTAALTGVVALTAPALAVVACSSLHCFLWPPSVQWARWHSVEQYHTCVGHTRGIGDEWGGRTA
jgi:hypothetical protein